jgi:hypothetical protein
MTSTYKDSQVIIPTADFGEVDIKLQETIKLAADLNIPYPMLIGLLQTHLHAITQQFILMQSQQIMQAQALYNVGAANGQPI